MNAVPDVRPSPIAGAWYSADPVMLRQQVDRYLASANIPQIDGEVVALVAPHAGHRYSGATAGHAFAAVMGQERPLVAVLSPMHGPHPAGLLTTAHKAYGTPLGPVPVDQRALAQLSQILAAQQLELTPVAHDREHSLEIELPFLQRALRGGFQLLPVMIRSQSPRVAQQLGLALAEVLRGQNCLLVASTDLSHFYSEETANELDQEMLRRISNFSPDALFEAEQAGIGYACGTAAVAAVLWASRVLGADAVQVLHHSTSGDETGDRDSVVGYGAAVVLKRS